MEQMEQTEKEQIKYKKLKVFLTGYLGFRDIKENPTEKLVKAIIDKKDLFNKENVEIINHKLFEVTTDYVDNNVHSFYKEIEHDKEGDVLFLIVHFGLYTALTIPQIETTAKNYISDEFNNGPICEKDGKCFLSKLDTKSIVQNINSTCGEGEKCKISHDAGKYLCNYIFYKSLKYYEHTPNVIATFIHIPLFEKYPLEQDIIFFKKFLEIIKNIYIKSD